MSDKKTRITVEGDDSGAGRMFDELGEKAVRSLTAIGDARKFIDELGQSLAALSGHYGALATGAQSARAETRGLSNDFLAMGGQVNSLVGGVKDLIDELGKLGVTRGQMGALGGAAAAGAAGAAAIDYFYTQPTLSAGRQEAARGDLSQERAVIFDQAVAEMGREQAMKFYNSAQAAGVRAWNPNGEVGASAQASDTAFVETFRSLWESERARRAGLAGKINFGFSAAAGGFPGAGGAPSSFDGELARARDALAAIGASPRALAEQQASQWASRQLERGGMNFDDIARTKSQLADLYEQQALRRQEVEKEAADKTRLAELDRQAVEDADALNQRLMTRAELGDEEKRKAFELLSAGKIDESLYGRAVADIDRRGRPDQRITTAPFSTTHYATGLAGRFEDTRTPEQRAAGETAKRIAELKEQQAREAQDAKQVLTDILAAVREGNRGAETVPVQ